MLVDLQTESFIKSIINVPIPIYVCNALQEINTLLAQTQIEYINKTINYIKHNNIPASLLSTNINKCIHWCNKYHIHINTKVHDIKNIRI